MTQGSTVYSSYLSDQLREDMKRDDLVSDGKLTRTEADQQADEWAEVCRTIISCLGLEISFYFTNVVR